MNKLGALMAEQAVKMRAIELRLVVARSSFWVREHLPGASDRQLVERLEELPKYSTDLNAMQAAVKARSRNGQQWLTEYHNNLSKVVCAKIANTVSNQRLWELCVEATAHQRMCAYLLTDGVIAIDEATNEP